MDHSTSCATVLTTEEFDTWLSDLRDGQGRARIQARIDRAAAGNLGTCAPVGEGVSYFVQRGLELIILLAGGDQSTQAKGIALAKELARRL